MVLRDIGPSARPAVPAIGSPQENRQANGAAECPECVRLGIPKLFEGDLSDRSTVLDVDSPNGGAVLERLVAAPFSPHCQYCKLFDLKQLVVVSTIPLPVKLPSTLAANPNLRSEISITRPGEANRVDFWYWEISPTGSFPNKTQETFGAVSKNAGGPVRAVSLVQPNPDYPRILSWLRECSDNHIGCHQERSEKLRTINLIDVEKREVIHYPSTGHIRYLALSYVWGDAIQPPGTLGPLPSGLAATVADAIHVTKQLGIQYLWVDSVCISHHDSAHKISQIAIMNEIYSGAYATIVDLEGKSANDGLSRVRATADQTCQIVLESPTMTFASAQPELAYEVRDSKWSTRGWTLQESVFSRRKLFFTERGVYLTCIRGEIDESAVEWTEHEDKKRAQTWAGSSLVNPVSLQHLSVTLARDQAFTVYNEYLDDYLTRSLTRSNDIINGFSGILNQLQSHCFPLGFIYGVPRNFIVSSLMWFDTRYLRAIPGTMSRREGFPSWSWTGWNRPRLWYFDPTGRDEMAFIASLFTSDGKPVLEPTDEDGFRTFVDAANSSRSFPGRWWDLEQQHLSHVLSRLPQTSLLTRDLFRRGSEREYELNGETVDRHLRVKTLVLTLYATRAGSLIFPPALNPGATELGAEFDWDKIRSLNSYDRAFAWDELGAFELLKEHGLSGTQTEELDADGRPRGNCWEFKGRSVVRADVVALSFGFRDQERVMNTLVVEWHNDIAYKVGVLRIKIRQSGRRFLKETNARVLEFYLG